MVYDEVTSSIEAFQRIINAKDCPKKVKKLLIKIVERMRTLNLSDPEDITFLETTAKELENLARNYYTVGV
jgi:hypothetical protein